MNVAKRNTNDMAYLVRQGQEVVVEEDGYDCRCIILAEMSRSQSKKRWRSMPTLPAVLGISESMDRECSLMNRRRLTYDCRCR